MPERTGLPITSARLSQFKAFRDFSVSLNRLNVVVGPNNSGKSTLLSAFRALEVAMRRARSRRADRIAELGHAPGYIITESQLPLSLENIHTDYEDVDSSVSFRLSNGNSLRLLFLANGGTILAPDAGGKPLPTTKSFSKQFPLSIASVPILGPVEHEERQVKRETVETNLPTHRAARNFRNFWYYYPERFDAFADLVARTWPGMEIRRPEPRPTHRGVVLDMFCTENRVARELYWSGIGFQIWCQLLTHIAISQDADFLVVDEADIYLHPDIQRRLLGVLRQTSAQVLLATHSSEIMSEAEPSELLFVDKTKRSAKRIKNVEGVQQALEAVGSVQNITLAHLAKDGRALFVEGLEDFKLLRRFADIVGKPELASGLGITPVETEGFGAWKKVRDFAWGLGKLVPGRLKVGAVFDRDFFSREEIDYVASQLRENLEWVWVHEIKEIENYLLIPDVLLHAIGRGFKERHGRDMVTEAQLESWLFQITNPMHLDLQAQYVSKRNNHLRAKGRDESTLTRETIAWFMDKWSSLEGRLEVASGKQVLRGLRDLLQREHQVTLTHTRILQSFRARHAQPGLLRLLEELDEFRRE